MTGIRDIEKQGRYVGTLMPFIFDGFSRDIFLYSIRNNLTGKFNPHKGNVKVLLACDKICEE